MSEATKFPLKSLNVKKHKHIYDENLQVMTQGNFF